MLVDAHHFKNLKCASVTMWRISVAPRCDAADER
jgi:hypothetical protein